MSGLLKADFYRLFRSKFFYILGGVVLLLSLAVFALFALIVEFGGEIGGAMTAGALQRLSFDGTVGYCAAIAVAVFVCSDFSGGGIRDKVARGCGRGKVFFSLWIALSFAVLVYYLLTQFVVFALGGAAFGWEGVRAAEAVSLFVAGVGISLANAAIFCALSVLLKKISSALLVGILLLFGVSLLQGVLAVAEIYIGKEAFSVFCDVFAYLTPAGQTSLLASGGNGWIAAAASCGWLLLVGLGVPPLFARQDLK